MSYQTGFMLFTEMLHISLSNFLFFLHFEIDIHFNGILPRDRIQVNLKCVCLFVWVYRHTREFFTHMKTSPLPVKGFLTYFDLYSALMSIVQWGFLRVPHQSLHGASFYNGNLQGPVTLTLIAEPVTTCFYDLGCRSWDYHCRGNWNVSLFAC